MCTAAAAGGETRALLLLQHIRPAEQMLSRSWSEGLPLGEHCSCGLHALLTCFSRVYDFAIASLHTLPCELRKLTGVQLPAVMRRRCCCSIDAGLPVLSQATQAHASSATLQLSSKYPPASMGAADSESTTRSHPSRLQADGSCAAWSSVRRCSGRTDSAALISDTEPDSSSFRTASLNSLDPDSPAHAKVSLGQRMAGMSLGQSSGNASLSSPISAEPAPAPRGYAVESFLPSAVKAHQPCNRNSQGNGRICSHLADGPLTAPLSPHQHPPQPPQTPPPPPPIHPSYTIMRTSSSGESVLQVIHAPGTHALTGLLYAPSRNPFVLISEESCGLFVQAGEEHGASVLRTACSQPNTTVPAVVEQVRHSLQKHHCLYAGPYPTHLPAAACLRQHCAHGCHLYP